MPTEKSYFSYETDRKLACSCGQCPNNGRGIQPHFFGTLNAVREKWGKPIIVTSGYRCPAYNAKVSSTGAGGPHTTGLAVDISLSGWPTSDVVRFIKLLWDMGIDRVGVKAHGDRAKRFLHFDTSPHHPSPAFWTYP